MPFLPWSPAPLTCLISPRSRGHLLLHSHLLFLSLEGIRERRGISLICLSPSDTITAITRFSGQHSPERNSYSGKGSRNLFTTHVFLCGPFPPQVRQISYMQKRALPKFNNSSMNKWNGPAFFNCYFRSHVNNSSVVPIVPNTLSFQQKLWTFHRTVICTLLSSFAA